MPTVEYAIKITDQFTAVFGKLGTGVDKITSKFSSIDKAINKTGVSINGLNATMGKLTLARNASTSTTEIIRLNREIGTLSKQARKLESLPPQSFLSRLKQIPELLAGISLKDIGLFYVARQTQQYVKQSVTAYKQESVEQQKLATIMRNTMNARDEEIDSIKKLASEQQKLGVVGDEVQIAGAQELATYLTKAESIKKLLPSMNDMLAQQYGLNASQEQAVNIAQMIGKVLDGQTGALSRYGYSFDDAQEKVLKFGTEQQRVAMLSQILQKYVGGVNKALAETPEGKQQQIANNISDISERVGGLFVKVKTALNPLLDMFTQKLNGLLDVIERRNIIPTLVERFEKFIGFLRENRTTIETLTKVTVGYMAVLKAISITKGITAAATAFFTLSLKDLQFNLFRVQYALFNVSNGLKGFTVKSLIGAGAAKIFSGAMGIMSIAMKGVTFAVRGLSTAIYSIPIVGWILAGISAVITVLKVLWDKSRSFRQLLFGTWEALKAVFHNIGVVVKNVWNVIIKPLAQGVIVVFSAIKNALVAAWTGVRDFFVGIWDTVTGALATAWESVTGFFQNIWGWMKTTFGAITNFVSKWIVEPIKSAFSSVWEFIKGIFNKIIEKLSAVFRPIINLWNRIFSGDFENVSEAYVQGSIEGGEHFDREKGHVKAGSGESDFALPSFEMTPTLKNTDNEGSKDRSTGAPIGDSKGGAGGSDRNISIHIGKLMDSVNIYTTNMRESKEKIREAVAEALLTAVNDVNLVV